MRRTLRAWDERLLAAGGRGAAGLVMAAALTIAGLDLALVGSGVVGPAPSLSLPTNAVLVAGNPDEATPSPPARSTPASNSVGSVSIPDLMDLAAAGRDALPVGIEPSRLRVPRLGIDAPLVELGYATESAIEVPTTAREAGWFTPSRRPGEIGPAIIAGHVDWTDGPAVFFRLRELRPGDRILVEGRDGDLRTFVVDGLAQFAKDALPAEVFGFGAARPELRLITCGGTFDRATGHYRDNIVVYSHLEEVPA